MTRELILILGGARAGKSDYAQRLASDMGKRVLFIATAEPGDEDMTRRIEKHRAVRPETWHTLEVPLEVARELEPVQNDYDVVVLDCLTLWVSNLLLDRGEAPDMETHITEKARRLLQAFEQSRASWVVVSNEVGMGIVPSTRLGRRYRDALGRVNAMFAKKATRVLLMVAGLPWELKHP